MQGLGLARRAAAARARSTSPAPLPSPQPPPPHLLLASLALGLLAAGVSQARACLGQHLLLVLQHNVSNEGCGGGSVGPHARQHTCPAPSRPRMLARGTCQPAHPALPQGAHALRACPPHPCPRGRGEPAWILGWGQSRLGAGAAGRRARRTPPSPQPCRCERKAGGGGGKNRQAAEPRRAVAVQPRCVPPTHPPARPPPTHPPARTPPRPAHITSPPPFTHTRAHSSFS